MSATKPAGGVTVTVTEPFQVAYDGKVHGPGAKVTVPASVAELWRINGWVS